MTGAPQPLAPLGYTREELEAKLVAMRAAAAVFYEMAQRIEFHQFLDFTGFLNEVIKSCEKALARDIDFVTERVPIAPHEAAYIGEKFGCMFGEMFAGDPKLIRWFCREAFGVEVQVNVRGETR